jgi:hypothetical protein
MRNTVLTGWFYSFVDVALKVEKLFELTGRYQRFDPEDGGSMFLLIVVYLQVHTALQPRRPT